MQSLALELGKALSGKTLEHDDLTASAGSVTAERNDYLKNCDSKPTNKKSENLVVRVTSPSATVRSNENVEVWADDTAQKYPVEYRSLAASLEQQLRALCRKIPAIRPVNGGDKKDDQRKIVILTEESTFGRGVHDIVTSWKKSESTSDNAKNCPTADAQTDLDKDTLEDWCCAQRIHVAQFPQNIYAIRAEHSNLNRKEREKLRRSTQSKSHMLELDLSTVDGSADRPPPYDPMLSSRSDELMLYGTFNALRVRVKPAAVAIVATDVRDRLFLLNEVRKNLPSALPVLLEMDFLTTHPDYRKISRGSVVIPSGNTLVRLDRDTGLIAKNRTSGNSVDYYSFASDYSANMFRAALEFIDDSYANKHVYEPVPLVTTLAGFQELDGTRSTLMAADSRLDLEHPGYWLFLVCGILILLVGWWLIVNNRWAVVMLPPLSKWDSKRSETKGASVVSRSAERWMKWAPLVLMSMSVILLVISATHLVLFEVRDPKDLNWYLPHGRDQWALICLYLIYAAFALIGFWRFALWRERYKSFLGVGGKQHDSDEGFGKIELALWLGIPAAVVLLVLYGTIPTPVSVDNPRFPMVISCLILTAGAWFLVQFRRQSRNWTRLAAMVLGQTIDWVSQNTTGNSTSGEKGWPSPMLLGERPQSPFNLRFRSVHLDALDDSPDTAVWSQNTRTLMEGHRCDPRVEVCLGCVVKALRFRSPYDDVFEFTRGLCPCDPACGCGRTITKLVL